MKAVCMMCGLSITLCASSIASGQYGTFDFREVNPVTPTKAQTRAANRAFQRVVNRCFQQCYDNDLQCLRDSSGFVDVDGTSVEIDTCDQSCVEHCHESPFVHPCDVDSSTEPDLCTGVGQAVERMGGAERMLQEMGGGNPEDDGIFKMME